MAAEGAVIHELISDNRAGYEKVVEPNDSL